MSAPDDAGQAFPRSLTSLNSDMRGGFARETLGMSLRDYFAAQALLMAGVFRLHDGQDELINDAVARDIAFKAYRLADAMLALRRASEEASP